MNKCIFCDVINDDENYDSTVTCVSNYCHIKEAILHHWYCKKCLQFWYILEDKSMFIDMDIKFNFKIEDVPNPVRSE